MPRGRPHGSYGIKTYTRLASELGANKATKKYIAEIAKRETKKEVKKEIHSGRPHAQTQSAQIIGGKIKLKISKARSVRIGRKVVEV